MFRGREFPHIARTRDAPTRTNGRLLLVAGLGCFRAMQVAGAAAKKASAVDQLHSTFGV